MSGRRRTLSRSLSDSGFAVNLQELADVAYINTSMLLRQNADILLRKRMEPSKAASAQETATRDALKDRTNRESKAIVMDQSLGVLNMVLDSMSKEFEVPMSSISDGLLDSHPPSYDSLTDTKSIVSYGDFPAVDDTPVKPLHNKSSDGYDYPECYDLVLRPPDFDPGSLSDDDVRHLMQSVGGLHKKLDLLQNKMNSLLQQKSDTKATQKEEKSQLPQETVDSKHQFVAQKCFQKSAKTCFDKRGLHQRDTVYVQLDQIYCNLQRLHFPFGAMDDYVRGFPLSKAPAKVQRSTASTQTAADDCAEIKIAFLKEKCERLEKENAELTAQVKDLSKVRAPVPAPRQSREKGSMNLSASEENQGPVYTTVDCVTGPPTSLLPDSPPPENIHITEVTYEWTIKDYSRQLQEQKSDLSLKTMSAPFYITHRGYRVRMEAYLDGDGDAKGSFLSVFLRLLPGRNDDLLSWPAQLRMSFMLVNQTENRRGSIKTVVEHSFPRPSSGACDRHGGDRDCWGVLNLASHKLVNSQQFIRKDRLLLQCRVHILSN